MYQRIIAVVLAVVLLLTIGLTGLSVFSMRNQQINNRLTELTKDAREIAYLSMQSNSSVNKALSNAAALQMMYTKTAAVHEEYNAYIVVVEPTGRVLDNYTRIYADNPAMIGSLDVEEIQNALQKVLVGEEVAVRVNVNDMPVFTVGVPYVENDVVYCAVLIQTAAQRIEDGLSDIIMPIAFMAVLVMLIATVAITVLIKSTMKPLRVLTEASTAMADGNFNVTVPQDAKATREIKDLSRAFNLMAAKLKVTELSRREFVANVSHELRSPITSISGFVQGMEDGTIPPEEHQHYLAIVGDETRRLTKLISALLSLSRLDREDAVLECRDFDICEMLRRAIIRRITDLENKQIEVECDFVADPCMVYADSDRIEQVIVNLLDNAIKFTPEKGVITLRAWREGEKCYVRVKDSGIGILPEDRPRVFERFFTVDRAHTSGKGTGLGLSICQRIMEMHGQNISLEDTPAGEGASFLFSLARAKG